ncbi:MAG TPA: hypothetical protein VKY19_12900 [Ktedonosporobacter sp.]|nr:hypothetical protein [Ktedonosporobacter sp.]
MLFILQHWKDEERSLLSWYHLHSPMPRSIDLKRTAISTRSDHGEQPAQFYSRSSRFLLAASGFFSRVAHTDLSPAVRSLHAAVPATRPFTAFRYAIVVYLAGQPVAPRFIVGVTPTAL